MYKCQICNNVVPPGTRCCKYVENTRSKQYSIRPKANPGYIRKNNVSTKSRKTRDRVDDYGGSGWEIAREINCCPQCFAKLEDKDERKARSVARRQSNQTDG